MYLQGLKTGEIELYFCAERDKFENIKKYLGYLASVQVFWMETHKLTLASLAIQ